MGGEKIGPDSGSYSGRGNEAYDKKASYEVVLPLVDGVRWPSRCALCGAPHPEKTATVMDSWRSSNYLVAKKTSTLQFKGVPLCRYCHKDTTFSPLQIIVILTGFILGIGTFFGFVMYNDGYFCGGCMGGMLVVIVFFILGALVVGGGIKSPAVELKVGTEGKTVGKNRATMMRFKFRNPKYGEDFEKMNDPNYSKNQTALNW